ncbi:MAG TPA: PepSY domain-containing protein [Sphingomonas sp.]|nr:PepSY domain-containing protein [Sphingomonas sp.]
MRLTSPFVFLPVAMLAAGTAIAAQHAGPPARLTKAQAEAIALKAAPGKAVEAEYEKENGAWRYSFDIRQGNRIHEIGVDPNTGKIIENSYEGSHDKD